MTAESTPSELTHDTIPSIYRLVTTLAAPTLALSQPNGDIHAEPGSASVQGVVHADQRVFSIVELLVNDAPLVPLQHVLGAGETRFVGLVADAHTDVRCDRVRRLEPGRLVETMTLSSVLTEPVEVSVAVVLGSDVAPMDVWRVGGTNPPVDLDAIIDADSAIWSAGGVDVRLEAPGAQVLEGEDGMLLRWELTLAPHQPLNVTWTATITDPGGAVVAARTPGMDVNAIVERLTGEMSTNRGRIVRPWLRQSLHDLNSLRMSLPALPDASFFAAGSPWFLTLFGRDSIWTARMLLPVNLADAVGTLRTLAYLQGTKDDVDAAEAPGKIMHELRREALEFGESVLPPLYFGTIDATALWVCLFHDCWQAGRDEAVAREPDPTLRAAWPWFLGEAVADGAGFAEYIDASGHGLANQGWKDSGDSNRFHDGSQAAPPVALCEVQGYAHEAMLGAASILTDLDEEGGKGLLVWGKQLAARFGEALWCEVGEDRFPAIGLDGQKRRVDSVRSSIGHLLGTGLLNRDEEKLVVVRLMRPDMQDGFGLRTMASSEAAYNPLSYHCGTIWAHDTAVVMANLMRAGFRDEARTLADGLSRSAALFEQRMPELYSGEGHGIPYPASCRPQAWSAAAGVVAALMG